MVILLSDIYSKLKNGEMEKIIFQNSKLLRDSNVPAKNGQIFELLLFLFTFCTVKSTNRTVVTENKYQKLVMIKTSKLKSKMIIKTFKDWDISLNLFKSLLLLLVQIYQYHNLSE